MDISRAERAGDAAQPEHDAARLGSSGAAPGPVRHVDTDSRAAVPAEPAQRGAGGPDGEPDPAPELHLRRRGPDAAPTQPHAGRPRDGHCQRGTSATRIAIDVRDAERPGEGRGLDARRLFGAWLAEALYAAVGVLGDVERAAAVERDELRVRQLARTGAGRAGLAARRALLERGHRVVGHDVLAESAQECGGGREHRHPPVERLGDVDPSVWRDCDADRLVEDSRAVRARPGAAAAAAAEDRAGGPRLAAGRRRADLELVLPVARHDVGSERVPERVVGSEDRHAPVVPLGDVDVPGRIDGGGRGEGERAGVAAADARAASRGAAVRPAAEYAIDPLAERAHEPPVARVERNPAVDGVRDPQHAGGIDRHRLRSGERARSRTGLATLAALRTDLGARPGVRRVDVPAERAQEPPLLVEHRDPAVGRLGHVEHALGVGGNAHGAVERALLPPRHPVLAHGGALLELAVCVARDDVLAEGAQERPARREHRDAVQLRDVHPAAAVHRYPERRIEQAGLIARPLAELTERDDRMRRDRMQRHMGGERCHSDKNGYRERRTRDVHRGDARGRTPNPHRDKCPTSRARN